MTRRRSSRSRPALAIVGATAALLFPFLFYVWSHVQIVSIGYQVEQTEARFDMLEQRNRALRLERSRLTALDGIERRARRLGLEPVPLARLLVVSPRGAGAPSAPPPLPDAPGPGGAPSGEAP